MLSSILLLVVGLAILIAGGESLVRGACSMAKKFKISQLVIGLTIVAFGTSAPELMVNIFSAIRGSTDLAVGNIIGSNIVNILFILGLSAVIYPLSVQKSTTWKEIPFALLAAILIFVFGNDLLLGSKEPNFLSRGEGLGLIGFFVIFLYYIFGISKNSDENKENIKEYGWFVSILAVAGGIIGLAYGGKILVENAVNLAKIAGLSESLIGLTIVAVGTSLPELVTSVIAVTRKHDDIAIGNVVGSNIFNIFWILGITAIIKPIPFNSSMNFDILMNILTTILLFVFLFIGKKRVIERKQGVIFVTSYIVYIWYIVGRG